MHYARLVVGRFFVHLGLNVLPPGRVKNEFRQLLEDWADRIYAEVAKADLQKSNRN